MKVTSFTQIICENVHYPPLAGKHFDYRTISCRGG